jgi:hypothetical protein
MSKAKGPNDGRNSTANPAVSKYATLSEADSASEASWEGVDGRAIKAAIVAATEDGCALIFGKTSDGGALSLTLLHSGAPVKRWPKSATSAESMLEEIRSRAMG